MATVSSYQNAQGKKMYRVRFRTLDGKQTDRRGFKTKREAEAAMNRIEVEKASGSYVAPALGLITVGDMAQAWLDRKEATSAPSHHRTLDSAWRIHVKPRWGSVKLSAVSVLDVETWVASMTQAGSSPTTVIRAHGVLSGILSDAVKSRRLAANPASGVEGLPRKTAKKHIYLDAADVERLADAAEEHRVLVLVLAYCGLRWGEAISLRTSDVEFLRRRISVHRNAVQVGGTHHVGSTKGKENRSVPLPQFVLDALSVACKEKAPSTLIFGDGEHYLPRPKSSNGWLTRAVKSAGVQSITPHDLRHTAASLAVSAGANVLAVSRMLGHKSAALTLDTYADLFDSDLEAVATALDAVREKALRTVTT